ncbi:CPBP family intramembrane glutamic endopeptidase [Brevundimonas sp.]
MSSPRFSLPDLRHCWAEAANSPYLTRAYTRRPWLKLLGLLGLSFAFMIVGGLGVRAVLALSGVMMPDLVGAIPDGTLRLDGEIGFMALLAVSLMLLAVAVLFAAMIVYRRAGPEFLWPGRSFSPRLLLAGFGIMAAVSVVLLGVSVLFEPATAPAPILNPDYPLNSRLAYAGAAVVLLLIAALAEEIVFRAVLLRVTAGLTRRLWLICLLNAVLFSAIHLDPDPTAFVARALSGFIWTWAALRLGGIEFAVGAHLANNLLIVWLIEPMSSAALPGQAIPPIYLVFEVVTVAVVFVAVERIARRRRTTEIAV